MNKTLAQSNNGSLPVLYTMPGNCIKLKNPGASKMCAQVRREPKVVQESLNMPFKLDSQNATLLKFMLQSQEQF